jgi:hypothetical protein
VSFCSTLNPLSSCKLDQNLWHRVEKDLYLNAGWVSKAYVHVKRKREEELTDEDRVIVDVRIGKLDPAMGEKAEANEKWESRAAGVWLKRSAKRHASDSKKSITAVDVLFGADAVEPRPGWELVKPGSLLLDNAGETKEPRLSIRRGPVVKFEKKVPRIRNDGKFKILQVSDLHLSTGLGACRDPEPKEHNGGKCDADPRTLDFVNRVIDEEKPDFVVLSGDQVNGETAPDAQSVSQDIMYLWFYANLCNRLSSRLQVFSSSTKFHMLQSLEITTMKVLFRVTLRCRSMNRSLTPSPRPARTQSRE